MTTALLRANTRRKGKKGREIENGPGSILWPLTTETEDRRRRGKR
jgi:hypothetical protein